MRARSIRLSRESVPVIEKVYLLKVYQPYETGRVALKDILHQHALSFFTVDAAEVSDPHIYRLCSFFFTGYLKKTGAGNTLKE